MHLLTAMTISIPLGLITAYLMVIASRARRNKVVTGVQGLIGEIGVAQSPLVPEGKVFIHGGNLERDFLGTRPNRRESCSAPGRGPAPGSERPFRLPAISPVASAVP